MSARPATPPTTPPTMAPVLDEEVEVEEELEPVVMGREEVKVWVAWVVRVETWPAASVEIIVVCTTVETTTFVVLVADVLLPLPIA